MNRSDWVLPSEGRGLRAGMGLCAAFIAHILNLLDEALSNSLTNAFFNERGHYSGNACPVGSLSDQLLKITDRHH
jgi:hypothetical protein